MIQSNYDYFGSGVVVAGMGFPLHNRGALFALEANDPDALAPRKRPFHTIIPAFMERGDIHIVFGIMGGSNQPLAHAQLASNFVDYGMNIQAALDAPRFTIPDTGTRHRLRHPCGVARRSGRFETASAKRPQVESSQGIFRHDGKGASRSPRF